MGYENPLAIQPIAKTGSLNKQPDQSLIKAIAANDQRAMRALYERHSSVVLRFISRLNVDVGEAEDLLSEVFIDVWNQAGEFEGRSQVSTWILAIARFKALTALRRRRDLELDEAAVELIEDTADTPEQIIDNQDLSAQLRTCLAQMSREHREVIDLFYYREKSLEEVARITRTPKNTVKTRVYYARKQLGALLSRDGDLGQHATRRAA
jgi:RNA polymerase sigma-70 factor, ECF subfamily